MNEKVAETVESDLTRAIATLRDQWRENQRRIGPDAVGRVFQQCAADLDALLALQPTTTPEGLCTACSATQYCAEHEPAALQQEPQQNELVIWRCMECGAVLLSPRAHQHANKVRRMIARQADDSAPAMSDQQIRIGQSADEAIQESDTTPVSRVVPPEPRPDEYYERLVEQARDISTLLAGANVGPCPLPEGVRRVIEQRDALGGAVDSLGVQIGSQEHLDWQRIDTAPKDGTEILLTDGHYKRTGYWAKRINAWSVDSVVGLQPPTHWLSLPPFSQQLTARGGKETVG